MTDISHNIAAYLRTYPVGDVVLAIREWYKYKFDIIQTAREAKDRLFEKGGAWTQFNGGQDSIPHGVEWMKIRNVIFIRLPEPGNESATRKAKRSNTDVSRINDLRCPSCGAGMYKEGVCPACEDGRKGYRIRLLCEECDKTILL